MMDDNLGSRALKRRLEIGISQDELAKRMGYKSRASINKIEMNKADLPQKKIFKLAECLGVTPAYLMGWEEEENTYKQVGKVLTNLRKMRNESIEEIATELHIPADLINDYENATKKIPLNVLIEFAKYYKISIDELFGLKFNDANNTTFITTDKKMAEQYKRWNEQIGYDNNLTDEEIDKIISYAKFLISERKK